MDISIDWQVPVQLTRFKKIIVDENELPDAIKEWAGVYFFSRKHGSRYLPFYIGETLTLQKRLKGHLNWTNSPTCCEAYMSAIVAISKSNKGTASYGGCASNDNFCNLAKPFDAGEPSSRKWSTAFGQCHAAIQTHSIRTFCAFLHNACPEVRVRSYDAKHICGRSASRYRPACAGVAISHRCPISQLPERPSRW